MPPKLRINLIIITFLNNHNFWNKNHSTRLCSQITTANNTMHPIRPQNDFISHEPPQIRSSTTDVFHDLQWSTPHRWPQHPPPYSSSAPYLLPPFLHVTVCSVTGRRRRKIHRYFPHATLSCSTNAPLPATTARKVKQRTKSSINFALDSNISHRPRLTNCVKLAKSHRTSPPLMKMVPTTETDMKYF